MKKCKEVDPKLYALVNGYWQHDRTPGLIPIHKLESLTEKKLAIIPQVCSAIAYSLLIPLEERIIKKPEWRAVRNAYPSLDLSNFAVFSKPSPPTLISQIFIVDFTILTNVKKQDYINKNKEVIERIVIELEQLGKSTMKYL